MISKRELGYVSSWARNVPYPGYDYSKETLLKLKESLIKYNEIFSGTQCNIAFSNSEEITLEILSSNVAHMLGIDYKGLMSDFGTSFRERVLNIDSNVERVTSYLMLNRIVDCMDDVINYEDKNGNRCLNFYKIRVKCEIFEKMANLMDFNFGCINFDRRIYDKFSPSGFSSNSSKLLFAQSNEAVSPYFMIGIKPDVQIQNEINTEVSDDAELGGTKDPKYIVETLFAPSSPEHLFKEQEVVIPTQILFDRNDILTKTFATPDQKRKIMTMYREIVRNYGLKNRLNIYGDYMELLSQQEGFQKTMQRV